MLEILTEKEFTMSVGENPEYIGIRGIKKTKDSPFFSDYYDDYFVYFRYTNPGITLSDKGIQFIWLGSLKEKIMIDINQFLEPLRSKESIDEFRDYLELDFLQRGDELFTSFLDSIPNPTIVSDKIVEYKANADIEFRSVSSSAYQRLFPLGESCHWKMGDDIILAKSNWGDTVSLSTVTRGEEEYHKDGRIIAEIFLLKNGY